jgi:hypothetical protein
VSECGQRANFNWATPKAFASRRRLASFVPQSRDYGAPGEIFYDFGGNDVAAQFQLFSVSTSSF